MQELCGFHDTVVMVVLLMELVSKHDRYCITVLSHGLSQLFSRHPPTTQMSALRELDSCTPRVLQGLADLALHA